jgi:hypothetical protein
MVKRDKDGSKMLIGTATEDALMNDKAFKWFKDGYDQYRPDSISVKTIAKYASSLRLVAFGGTWCSDTHDLLPGFYKSMDAASIQPPQITLHLVNRDKKSKDGSAERYHVTNVPTFIIYLGDHEIGKIVESTKTSIEADIATILIDKK